MSIEAAQIIAESVEYLANCIVVVMVAVVFAISIK